MKVHFINVGYGESILVQIDGHNILVDGGTNREEEYLALGTIKTVEYLKKIGIHHLDLVVITHIHDDHIGGIPEVLKEMDATEIWMNVKPVLPDLKKIREFNSVRNGNLSGVLFQRALESLAEVYAICKEKGIPISVVDKKMALNYLKGDAQIELLFPDTGMQKELDQMFLMLSVEESEVTAENIFYKIDKQLNSTSLVLRISSGKTAVLLTGDKVDGWNQIASEEGIILESQILKVTHHGQKDGLPRTMMELADPRYFVICASLDRRFQSADPAIKLQAAEYLKRKNREGAVYVTGMLSELDMSNQELCAVYFQCDERSGEVFARFEKK